MRCSHLVLERDAVITGVPGLLLWSSCAMFRRLALVALALCALPSSALANPSISVSSSAVGGLKSLPATVKHRLTLTAGPTQETVGITTSGALVVSGDTLSVGPQTQTDPVPSAAPPGPHPGVRASFLGVLPSRSARSCPERAPAGLRDLGRKPAREHASRLERLSLPGRRRLGTRDGPAARSASRPVP